MLHEEITDRIIACAIAVHRAVGPGLAENSYQAAMAIEMHDQGLRFQSEPMLPVRYKSVLIGHHHPDFVVEDSIVVELKVVHALEPVHTAQVLTYLKVTRLQVGLLINFNVDALKFGIKRIVK